MAKRHERTLARRMAVQVLYQSEITGRSVRTIIAENEAIPDLGTLLAYSIELVEGVQANGDEIDRRLSEASENWALDRMPIVDRAIMRMAVCEMLYMDDVPVSVCINEAVELAREFGGEDESPRFANGILGRIARSEVGDAEVGDQTTAAGTVDAAVATETSASVDAAGEASHDVDAACAVEVSDSDALKELEGADGQ